MTAQKEESAKDTTSCNGTTRTRTVSRIAPPQPMTGTGRILDDDLFTGTITLQTGRSRHVTSDELFQILLLSMSTSPELISGFSEGSTSFPTPTPPTSRTIASSESTSAYNGDDMEEEQQRLAEIVSILQSALEIVNAPQEQHQQNGAGNEEE